MKRPWERVCRTEIRHAACERHVIELCEFLVALEKLSAMRTDLSLLRSAPQRLRSLVADVAAALAAAERERLCQCRGAGQG